MQMGDDDILDVRGLDSKAFQRIDRIERQLAGAGLRFFRVEAGIDQDVAAVPADQPDEIVEICRRGVMRIRLQEIHVRRARRHRRIAERVDFVGVSHRVTLLFCKRRNLGTKPLSSAKVKLACHGDAAKAA